jgi:hypothetical protein
MKPATLWLSSLACLLLGVGVAWLTTAPHASDPDSHGGGNPTSQSEKQPPARPGASPLSSSLLENARQASGPALDWLQLAARDDLDDAERHQLRLKLLAEWYESDPEAALRAALETIEREQFFSRGESLLIAFDAHIIADPERFLELVGDERFGLATGLARLHWIKTLANSEPDVLAELAGQLPDKSRLDAITQLLDRENNSVEQLDTWIATWFQWPDDSGNVAVYDRIGQEYANESFNDLVQMARKAEGEGAARVLRSALLARMGRSNDPDQVRQQIGLLPPDLRSAVVKDGIKLIENNPLAYTVMIDEVIAAGDWDLYPKEIPFRLHNMLSHAKDPIAIANWATTLPTENRFEDLYRVGIRSYVSSNPVEAMEWINAMPPGWHRDNSLVTYVQSSLNVRQNEEQARQALNMIRDPHFIKSGEEMFSKWQKR